MGWHTISSPVKIKKPAGSDNALGVACRSLLGACWGMDVVWGLIFLLTGYLCSMQKWLLKISAISV